MQQRVEPGEHGEAVIAAVIARLTEQRYLDDQSYAETYARVSARKTRSWDSAASATDMRQKGPRRPLVEKTLADRYAQTNEEALARQYLERKRMKKPANEKDTARVMRRLGTAGFSTPVIYKILRQWDVPDESLAALDNLEEDPHEE